MRLSQLKQTTIILIFLLQAMSASGIVMKPESKVKIEGLPAGAEASPSRLLDRANVLLTEKNLPDSALIYYSYVANYLTDDLSDDKIVAEKVRALNNIGYTYFYYFRDYQNAYYYLKKALEIARGHNHNDIVPYSLINLGHIYLTYQGIFEKKEYFTKAMDYYTEAFNYAVRSGNSDMTVISFLALAHQAIESNDLHWVNGEAIRSLRAVNPRTRLYKGALALSKAIEDLKRGNTRGALVRLEKSYADTGDDDMNIREKILTGHHLATLRHRISPADNQIPFLQELVAICDSTGQNDMSVDLFSTMSEFARECGDSLMADNYHLEYLKRKDSLVNKSNIYNIDHLELTDNIDRMETELDFRSRQRQMHLIVIALMLALLVVLVLFTINVVRKKKALVEKNKVLFAQAQEALRLPPVAFPEGEEKNETIVQPGAAGAESEPKGENKKKYYYSTLEKDNVDDILRRLNDFMETSEVVYSSGFSLSALAEALDEKESHISQVLNEYIGKKFRTFLNEYRIREASRRLLDRDGYGRYSIEAIAEGVGFKSRTNFISVFKQFTGLTPSEYRRIGKELKEQ